ncbi:hypothetical protein HS125_16655 [bacterium]|nr:hypothetical protein [bacterium]
MTLPGGEIETGCQFLDSIDHRRPYQDGAIGTLLNTGSIIVGENIQYLGLHPEVRAQFQPAAAAGAVGVRLREVSPTAERVLARRGRGLSPAMANLLRRVFETTAAERRKEWDR